MHLEKLQAPDYLFDLDVANTNIFCKANLMVDSLPAWQFDVAISCEDVFTVT